MVFIARNTLRKAVEEIAREMDGPRALADIAQEAARRSGRRYTDHTPQTVADALARLPFMVRCGPGTYAPVRIALHGKAFRVPLTRDELARGQLSKRRLEPFYTALEKPPVLAASGRELATVYLRETALGQLRTALLEATAEALRETPRRERYLRSRRAGEVPAEASHPAGLTRLDSGFIDLAPLGLAARGGDPPREELPDLIVRWDRAAGVLQAEIRPRGGDDGAAVAREDRILANFLASRLPPQNAVLLGSLLVEAYARFPDLGRTPGSAPWDVVQGDGRMRVVSGDGGALDEVVIARPGMRTRRDGHGAAPQEAHRWLAAWARQLRARIRDHPHRLAAAWQRERRRLGLSDTVLAGARGKVVLLRKPSHGELLAEWDRALAEQGLSDKVRRRKVAHVETFAHYLETDVPKAASHLLDVDEADLRSFFFWTYIRRYPNSGSDAVTFTLDLRDFYRHQQRAGRIADVRFAELIHGVRDMIVERLELYEGLHLLTDEPDFDDLYATLFRG
ncbi:MAG TPA: hypothetical protein VKZ69_00575 [Limnochordales bacterium]|nr:hypothetical protein [Limnochordales bacterium]